MTRPNHANMKRLPQLAGTWRVAQAGPGRRKVAIGGGSVAGAIDRVVTGASMKPCTVLSARPLQHMRSFVVKTVTAKR